MPNHCVVIASKIDKFHAVPTVLGFKKCMPVPAVSKYCGSATD